MCLLVLYSHLFFINFSSSSFSQLFMRQSSWHKIRVNGLKSVQRRNNHFTKVNLLFFKPIKTFRLIMWSFICIQIPIFCSNWNMSIWLVTEAHFVSLGYLWSDHFQLIAFTLATSDYFLYFYKPMMFAGWFSLFLLELVFSNI